MYQLAELYDHDFASAGLRAEHEIEVPSATARHRLRVRCYLDFQANAVFTTCFVPDVAHAEDLMRAAWRDRGLVSAVRTMDLKYHFKRTRPAIVSRDLRFTGRVWIYFDGVIEDAVVSRLIEEAEADGVSLYIRDQSYIESREDAETPVAFLCHDSADKETVAIPLARALRLRGVSVWLDRDYLLPGDSLRERIEGALRDSKKLIMLISQSFLTNKRWAAAEYSAAFSRETLEANRVIVPVWCGVNAREVAEHLPFMADRLAASWDGEAMSTAIQLEPVFK